MHWALEALSFLQSGVNSNWFGLGCPQHCRGSDFGGLIAAFLLGFLLGVVVVAWVLLKCLYPTRVVEQPQGPVFSSWAAPPAAPSSRLRSRLSGVHERQE